MHFLASTFWRPLHASQFFWQLLRVNRINERHVGLGPCVGQKPSLFWSTHDKPKHLRFGVVKHLTQRLRRNENAAVFRHGQRFVAYTDSTHSFQNEIELFRSD